MKKENYCYFEIIKTTKTQNSLYMMISDYGNISYFLKKATPLSENVIIKTFYLPQNLKIFSLAFTKNKIIKNEILYCLNKFN